MSFHAHHFQKRKPPVLSGPAVDHVLYALLNSHHTSGLCLLLLKQQQARQSSFVKKAAWSSKPDWYIFPGW